MRQQLTTTRSTGEVMFNSYGKVHHINHRAALGYDAGPLVVIQEKLDGSQFSFGVALGVLVCRSRNTVLDLDGAADHLFRPAIETAKRLHAQDLLPEGRVYRAEAMKARKHNLLAYDRAPDCGLVLFDVDGMGPDEASAEASRLGLEFAQILFRGTPAEAVERLATRSFLASESMLGGATIEGVVIKSYGILGLINRAKIVGDAFREVRASRGGKTKGATGKDPILALGARYATAARYAKARQHLAERGELRGDPSDIGRIVREVKADVAEECHEEIAAELWGILNRKILGEAARGVAEWFYGGAS